MNKIRIEGKGAGRGYGVFLDDQDISRALRGLKFSISLDDVARVELDAIALELETDAGDVRAHLPKATKELLIQLGWTPPTSEKENG